MLLSLRSFKLKTRMVLILGMMALLQTGLIGFFALAYLSHSLDEQIGQRALHVAKTIASIPEVIEAVENRDSELLQPLTIELANINDARFVVIGDRNGIRLAHPSWKRVGKPMYDDDGDYNEPALLYGKPYIQKATGSLGASVRGKAPIFDSNNENVVGIISVGFMLDTVEEIIDRYRNTLYLVIALSFGLSVLTGLWFASHFKKAIFGLEPEQIGQLFQERNATLESIREGIIAVNNQGNITTFNRAAIETLGLDANTQLTGKPIEEILPDSRLMNVMLSGKPQFDKEIWLQDRNLIVNRLPMHQDNEITGVVSSFRRKDELDLVSRRLTQIQKYADTLRSQSHEYSNKLHTIAGLIQIGATEEALALIGQETLSHQALIQLLVEAVPDPILAGCLLGKYNRAKELGLHLDIDPESSMKAIPDRIPREELVSILGNLIDNALEATLKNQKFEVKLSMTDLGNDLIFEIEDQGAGVPEEQHENIFRKGVTSKQGEGHGFGLHLVTKLLQKLGGTIMLEPGDKAGSRFTVYIPKDR
ncbi:histidine kinase [Enterovibrio norvegicus]|uniref:histidine kinase n=2 Tax=Enterovibrio norvegicus TaxID=188144 RepID=A0A1I5L9J7_9GAMM|nr:sensor histidine kinase [Enterovibrio norvegicus]OEE65655.1 histidine kinase [Enterovibrio norvegicus]OEF58177.1 histidine kinase [Enterovibrio norvegicus]OEF65017.1 histidine kinase [Enterovibrio norvegicus]PMH62426.1 histidine kinase [Enterovibrio norvegicus]PMI31346.1 histidine kinase [Enterovibrio norvegicus]